MQCVKTGFTAYLGGHRGYLHGDAFASKDGTLLLRICQIHQPRRDYILINYTIYSWDLWFEEEFTSQERNSTMVVSAGDYADYGYEGILHNKQRGVIK